MAALTSFSPRSFTPLLQADPGRPLYDENYEERHAGLPSGCPAADPGDEGGEQEQQKQQKQKQAKQEQQEQQGHKWRGGGRAGGPASS